jgi:hypothetical protein
MVINPKVVGYLVADDPLYLLCNLFLRATFSFNGLLKDSYLIWQHHAISHGALSVRYAFIQTQQSRAMSNPHLGELS